MKKRNLFLGASVALAVLASCSDDPLSSGSKVDVVKGTTSPMTVITDQAVLGKYVTNYGTKAATRAGMPAEFKGLTSMPDYDAVLAAAAAASEATYVDYATGAGLLNQYGGGDVHITGDVSDVQIGASNKNIYVSGNITITNTWGNNYNLYILKGGSVTWAGGNSGNISATQANVKFYNYGTLNSNDNVISLHGGTELWNADGAVLGLNEIIVNGGRTDWSTGSEVVYPSKLYVEGSLVGINLKAEKGCVVNVADGVDAEGLDLNFDGHVHIGGLLKAKNLTILNQCQFYSECGVICSEDFTINSNGSLSSLTYLKAKNVYQCAGSTIKLPNKGMMDIANIYQNLNNGNDAKVELTDAGFAVVKAKELHWNAGDPLTNVYLFKTPVGGQIVTDCEKYARLDNSMQPVYYEFSEFNFLGADVKRIESDADRTETIAPGTGCNEAGYNPQPDEDPVPTLTPIADLDRAHVHPISATCIAVDGNSAYVSWHLRGGNYWGCIEKISIDPTATDGKVVKLDAWMETPAYLPYTEEVTENGNTRKLGLSGKQITDITSADGYSADVAKKQAYDFNHIIIVGDHLITVGENHSKGGFIGRIPLASMTTDGTMDLLEAYMLGKTDENGKLVGGRSGNCVVASYVESTMMGNTEAGNMKLFVASRGGYQMIPYNINKPGYPEGSLGLGEGIKKSTVMSTAGSVKHLAYNGERLVSIEFTQEGNEVDAEWWDDNTSKLPATIKEWPVWAAYGGASSRYIWDFEEKYEKPSTIAENINISPIYGKNVIAYDGNDIYSCQGHLGIVKYKMSKNYLEDSDYSKDLYFGKTSTLNGTTGFSVSKYVEDNPQKFANLTEEKLNEVKFAAANGLCVDDRFVYIANGAAGLWVLNKSDLSYVAHYVDTAMQTVNGQETPNSASANYVQVMTVNGTKFVIVAYGRAGVRVFRMDNF